MKTASIAVDEHFPALQDDDISSLAAVKAPAQGVVLTAASATPAADDDDAEDAELLRQPQRLAEPIATPNADEPDRDAISVVDVARSVHSTFPLLAAAYEQTRIAAGKQLAAWGEFDTKLKAASEDGPLGFYETYRNSAGFTQPFYQGGELFGGYRVGRGSFQPWYLERQTNDGGEFKTGFNVPLLRNRDIDSRRAELWRATYERQIALPEVRAQLILFVRDGSVAYWEWIAAGLRYDIGEDALAIAEQRNEQVSKQVELGAVDPPVLQDNLRAIAQRDAKLIERRRKLDQSAIKLSLYYRTMDGQPIVPGESELTKFPEPVKISADRAEASVSVALAQRPEFRALDATARQIQVDVAEARNDLLPRVDAQIVGSQDVGAPTSSKRDKSQFELEAGIFVDVPLQRRKARGKLRAAQAKLAQLSAKRRFTEDKVRVEVQAAVVALNAAFERLVRARESKRLADYMADVERRTFEVGGSDLLAVALREQAAIEAADAEVDALLEYFIARADYNAALAREWPQTEGDGRQPPAASVR